jgi:small-conductance mechanosensitive channel
MPTIEQLSLDLADFMMPFIAVMLGIVVAMLIKDYATNIAKGISFKYFGPFKEGDHVMLEDHKSVIVKIGLTITVFGCDDDKRGYIWRYVPNNRIGILKLGKIISHAKKEL